MSKPTPPEGSRIYAVGDVHGCLEKLDCVLAKIAADIAAHPDEKAELIFLGDLIDRGPDSKGVIDRLSSGELPAPGTFLMGNHEDMLLEFLKRPQVGAHWARNGGDETLGSYGIAPGTLANTPELARDQFLKAMPQSHLAFFEGLELSAERGGYFFCHAGVQPGVPLDRQDRFTLLWIRDEFLSSEDDFGKVIVHGHTPVGAVELRPNRIGVDTGAVYSGTLSAIMLSGEEQRVTDSGR